MVQAAVVVRRRDVTDVDNDGRAVLIQPDWPRHPRVRACFTTREGGVSRGVYASLNLAHHVDDDAADILENRRRLREALALDRDPAWLDQVHGRQVTRLEGVALQRCADASWTDQPGAACAIMSADCLPVLFADDAGSCVAAAHAGWRGLAAGVLEATVAALPVAPQTLTAWFGPAIGPAAFEVGGEVRAAFVSQDAALAAAFKPGRGERWLCDLYALARKRLAAVGVTRVHGGDRCTVSEPREFFSYRRDGVCGRMAALVWLV